MRHHVTVRFAALLIATTMAIPAMAAEDVTTDKAPQKQAAAKAPAPQPATTRLSDAFTGDYTLDTHHASVTFRLNHMGFSNYTGRFNDVTADLHFDATDLSKSTLKANVATSSIDTHNSTLEAELLSKDWFNAKEFQDASFVATRVEKTGATTGKITGDLTLAGVTKPVVLDVVFNGGGTDPIAQKSKLGFSARTAIKRSDFGISKYIPMVGDTVALDIEAEFFKKD